MTYEDFLLKQLERSADRAVKESHDPEDKVTFDVPLLIRLLELAREDIKTDADLHHVVDRILAIKDRGILTMDDYEEIQGGVDKAVTTRPVSGQQANEPKLDELRRLAGL